MPYTVEHMEEGEWSLGLIENTPRRITDFLSVVDYAFASVLITPVEVDETALTDAGMLAQARYVGVFTEQQDNNLTLSGPGLVSWLGGDNDGGDMYAGADTTSATIDLEAQIDARVIAFANGLTKGAINQLSTTRQIKAPTATTRRQFLDTICALYPGGPYEWRVNTDGSIDVDRQGVLFPTTSAPSVILAADGGKATISPSSKFLALDGTGDFASAPDAAALDITGDITIAARVQLDTYGPVGGLADQTIVSKWNTTGNQRSYKLAILNTGELALSWSTAGAVEVVAKRALSLTNGAAYWVAASMDVNDGGGNRVINFYTSTDSTNDWRDVSWTLEGTTTTAGTTSIFASTAVARVGGIVGSTEMPTGRVYAAAVIPTATIGDGTAAVADPNFTMWPSGDSSEPDTAGNTWTLTGDAYIASQAGANLTGLPCSLEVSSVDVSDYRTNITTGDPNTAITGAASTAPAGTWKDFAGNVPVLRSLVHSTPRVSFTDHPHKWSARVGANKYAAWVLNSSGQATQMAVRIAESVNNYDRTVTAQVDCDDPGRFMDAGDSVYVWDQNLRLVDLTNEVYYLAEPAHPAKLRLRRMEVPFRDGMGAYLRYWNGSSFSYLNFTRYVAAEEGPATVELGTRARFHRPNARPRKINRKRLARQSRQHYRLSRYLGGGL